MVRKSAGVICALLVLALSTSAIAEVKVRTTTEIDNAKPGVTETAFGDLVADALRAAVKADVAFVSASETKQREQPFPPGELTESDIANLLSYQQEPIALVLLNGSQIKTALEKSLSIYPKPNMAFLQVSGLKVVFSPSSESENRVKSIQINGAEIDNNKNYSVAMSNSLANGALGYWRVWTNDAVKQRFSERPMLAVVRDYISTQGTIGYKDKNRITAAE